jgi:phosphate transport system ATP-binding protein
MPDAQAPPPEKQDPATRTDAAPMLTPRRADTTPTAHPQPAFGADSRLVIGEQAPGTRVMHADEWMVGFGQKRVLNGITLPVLRNTVLALIGPSGCGKTTFLRSLNRLLELAPTARWRGTITLDGEDIYASGQNLNLLRRRIGMVFQQPNPFPMSIFENVAFAMREQAQRRPRKGALNDRVEEVLRHAGLWDEVKDTLSRSAMSLSGGQQQRLCIARTLAARPEVMLMDEPCSALDPRSTAIIEELIRNVKREVTVVIVTHNMQQAKRVSDRAAFFLNGDLVEHGATAQVFDAPTHKETADYVSGAFG